MEFEAALPVKRDKTGGKTPAENPFTDVIADIALKTDANGPIARAFTLKHDSADDIKKDWARTSRQLKLAGENNDPEVTVYKSFEEANIEEGTGKNKVTHYATRVTFWTAKKIYKPRANETTSDVDATVTAA